MKKVFKLAAIATIATFTLVACNNNQPQTEDSTDLEMIEEYADDEMMDEYTEAPDTTPVVKEETTAKKAAKPAAKKAEQKVEKKAEQAVQATEQKINEVKAADNTPQTAPLKRKNR